MKYNEKLNEIDVSKIRSELLIDAKALIQKEDNRFQNEISEVCNYCIERNIEIILLCGPSAAGKTTTSKILERHLKQLGHQVNRISLDNFYKRKDMLPFWEDGERNLESIEGIDVALFTELVNKLFEEGESTFPVFEFNDSLSQRTFKLKHAPGGILIIEGIHALHPEIYNAVHGMRCCRLYISTHSNYIEDGDILLPARMLRLVRRIIRDEKHRSAPINMTMDMWKYIQMGEELYIYPYRHLSDFHIDTAHAYEPYLFSERLEKLLSGATPEKKHVALIEELTFSASNFRDYLLTYAHVPKTSLIQEFIR